MYDYQEEPLERMARLGPYNAQVLTDIVADRGVKDKDKKILQGVATDEPFLYIIKSLCVLLGEKDFIVSAPVSKNVVAESLQVPK